MTEDYSQHLWNPGAESPKHELEAAERLRFVLRQSFSYRYSGPVRAVEQQLVVVPRVRHGPQERKSHELHVLGADGHKYWAHDAFGNRVARVRLPAVQEAVEFRVDVVVERAGAKSVLLPAAALRDRRYLDSTPLTEPDHAIVEAAKNAAGGLAPEAAAERICAFVHQALPYRKDATHVGTTAAEAFAIGAGVCQDHAHVMLAMCRALGIHARYVSGHMLGEGYTHAWVEVIVPDPQRGGAVALPFDPCHGRHPGATYLTVAVGRDYRDVAPTSGTYHGRFENRLISTTRLDVEVIEGPK
jgi:transglutaminase-like putative cysteine protease